MATGIDRVRAAQAWGLVRTQHGVVTRAQLRELGLGESAIRHRLERGRLHRLLPGVYAAGRPGVNRQGRWMAAVLACGPQALLSHRSAAAALRIRKVRRGEPVEIVVPRGQRRRLPGIRVYQRAASGADRHDEAGPAVPRAVRWREIDGIPVTGPAATLVDLATCLPTGPLEAAVNEADHLDLVDPEALRAAIDLLPRRPGARRLRQLLDASGLALTSTVLERIFLPLALEAGLPLPTTQARLGGNRVDFYWEQLGLVVETDSLRYHRTAFKQAADKRRDNQNALAGRLTLRFTHREVRYEPEHVRAELRRAARRLARERVR
jgi:very-short-patch-repair endonuclease/predicted transcriptional regulator of viral defense system